MSVFKCINGRNSQLSQIEECCKYIKNPKKNSQNLSGTTGLSNDTPVEDMLTVKTLCNTLDGRQYIHSVLSFDEGVSSYVACEVGKEVLHLYEGEYQVLMCVHDNTNNVHCHFQLNTTASSGKKFSRSKNEMLVFREKINDILKAHGLRPIQKEEEITWQQLEMEDEGHKGNITPYKVPALYHANYNDEDYCEAMDSDEGCFNPFSHDFESEDFNKFSYEESVNPFSHVPEDKWDSPETLAYGQLLKLKAAEEIAKIKAERNGEVRAVYHEYPDEPWWEV